MQNIKGYSSKYLKFLWIQTIYVFNAVLCITWTSLKELLVPISYENFILLLKGNVSHNLQFSLYIRGVEFWNIS